MKKKWYLITANLIDHTKGDFLVKGSSKKKAIKLIKANYKTITTIYSCQAYKEDWIQVKQRVYIPNNSTVAGNSNVSTESMV